MDSDVAARCIICDHEVKSTDGLTACPKCGSKSIPCDPKQDVTVKINWHELRVICIWAEMHANKNEATCEPGTSMRQTVYSIVRRLEVQHPDIELPLTLGAELRELKKEFPNMETDIPHDEGFDPTAKD